MQVASLAQPRDQIIIEMMMAHRAQVNGPPETEIIHGHGGAAAIKIPCVICQGLAALGFDDVTPEPGGMHLACREPTLESEMVLLSRWQGIKFQHFQTEQVGKFTRITAVRCDVVLIDETGIEGPDQRAAILDIEF